jgi:hypothetical protein
MYFAWGADRHLHQVVPMVGQAAQFNQIGQYTEMK